MNPYLMFSGIALICFADKEAGSITFTCGTRVGWRYPLFGVILFIAGLVVGP